MCGHQENNVHLVFLVCWMLEELHGTGISIMISTKRTRISCLIPVLDTPSSCDIRNARTVLKEHLRKGDLISLPPSESLLRKKTSSMEEMEGKSAPHLSLSFDAYHSC